MLFLVSLAFASLMIATQAAPLTAGISAPTNLISNAGQSITLTATPAGGTGSPNTIQWYSSPQNVITRAWNSFNSSYDGNLLDSMQTGWSTNTTRATSRTDSAPGNFVEGTGSAALVVNADSFAEISKATNVNLNTASNFYFWVYTTNSHLLMNNSTGLELDFANAGNNGYSTKYF